MTTDAIADLMPLGLCLLCAAGSAAVTLAASRDAARELREENARLKRRVDRYRHGAEWLLSRAATMPQRQLEGLKRRAGRANDGYPPAGCGA